MKLSPHLVFDGRCAEAFRFYQSCLGGTLPMLLTWGGTPAAGHVPADWQDKIIHARLVSGDLVLLGSDAPPATYRPPGSTTNVVTCDTAEEAERVFAALGQDGETSMPMEETFFARRFGVLSDRFGMPWIVICEAGNACQAATP